jgi:hypothetical protein
MPESDNSKRKEDKAVQALISAALHVGEEEVTAEEIRPYLSGEVVLSAEDEDALKGLPPQFRQTGSFQEARHRLLVNKREELLAELRKKKKGGG